MHPLWIMERRKLRFWAKNIIRVSSALTQVPMGLAHFIFAVGSDTRNLKVYSYIGPSYNSWVLNAISSELLFTTKCKNITWPHRNLNRCCFPILVFCSKSYTCHNVSATLLEFVTLGGLVDTLPCCCYRCRCCCDCRCWCGDATTVLFLQQLTQNEILWSAFTPFKNASGLEILEGIKIFAKHSTRAGVGDSRPESFPERSNSEMSNWSYFYKILIRLPNRNNVQNLSNFDYWGQSFK